MSDFGEECTQVPLFCDSASAISVTKNPILHSKTKHIEVRYHFLRDNVEKGNIRLSFVPTQDQLADIFTKPLDQVTFTRLQGELVVCLPFWAGSWELLLYMCFIYDICIMFAFASHMYYIMIGLAIFVSYGVHYTFFIW
jgi:hypothetical protein